MLIFPHHTRSLVMSSFTMKRSLGERPVNSPVLIAIAPEEASTPHFLSKVSWCSSSAESW